MKRAAIAVALTATLSAVALADDRNFAGSVQLDYLGVPTEKLAREQAFDGATVELSLKLAMDFSDDVSSNVKICVACHGMEVAMAYFDVRFRDELNLRVGRFTPAFGAFPVRADPANHRTSDKPLPYDMGRMLHFREWNEGVLPAPWVDNGLELNGTHFLSDGQLDYAAYLVSGPKGNADAFDFDYTLSRSGERYYVDNNSQPAVGARVAATTELSSTSLVTLGASGMAGYYDPAAALSFLIIGADLTMRFDKVFVRAEYLVRRTEMAIGDDPASRFKYGPGLDGYADFSLRDGFYVETEVPIGKLELIGRWDGLRRFGNVAASSPLRSESAVLRYTAAAAYRVQGSLRLKTSVELWDFSDFDDEVGLHLGIAGPF